MNYTKTNPSITYQDFFKLAQEVKNFNSLNGKEYEVKSIDDNVMYFIRLGTGVIWHMNLKNVHQAYLNLTDFKTVNFKPYVNRRHSPALGLILHLGLLRK